MIKKEEQAPENRNKSKKKKIEINKKDITLIIIVITIILIDQITKIVIKSMGETSVISGILTFRINENTNGAYGIGASSSFMYVITNLVILSVILKFIMTQNEYVDKKIKIILSFILAGGISNVIDRIFRGYVLEFIDFKDKINIPVFNIADIFILLGWTAFVVIFISFIIKEWKKRK